LRARAARRRRRRSGSPAAARWDLRPFAAVRCLTGDLHPVFGDDQGGETPARTAAWSSATRTVPGAGRFLPGAAGLALAGNTDKLPAAVAVLLLVLYAAAASAAGWLATLRRDVA